MKHLGNITKISGKVDFKNRRVFAEDSNDKV